MIRVSNIAYLQIIVFKKRYKLLKRVIRDLFGLKVAMFSTVYYPIKRYIESQ